MNYPAASEKAAYDRNPTPRPPEQSILDLALARQAQQLERVQELRKRTGNLADRLLGNQPESGAVNGAAVDPGSTIGRLEGVQSMIESQLQAVFENVMRLERL